jgi:hypothetical protein
MMRPLSLPPLSWHPLSWPPLSLALIAAALSLSGCSNRYFERKDTVTFSAGDAVATNNALMIADPTPRRAYDTHIVTPGETAARAGDNYAQGRYKWYSEPGNKDEPVEGLNKTGASSPDRPSGAAPGGGASGGGVPGGGAPGGQ